MHLIILNKFNMTRSYHVLHYTLLIWVRVLLLSSQILNLLLGKEMLNNINRRLFATRSMVEKQVEVSGNNANLASGNRYINTPRCTKST